MWGKKMSKRCKFQNKPCNDRYLSSQRACKLCRLDEWKRKLKVCPYDNRITSKCHASRNKAQRKLK